MVGIVGLDYLSTLAYVPSVAARLSGDLAPLVMLAVAAVTLVGALPVYFYLAGRSIHGSGALGMLERLVPGWAGKMLVLVLLGFVATDLTFTRTFSSSDAAEHLIHSRHPVWQDHLNTVSAWWGENSGQLPGTLGTLAHGWSGRQVFATLVILVLGTAVALCFRKGFQGGFRRIATLVTLLYLVVVLACLVAGLVLMADRPEIVTDWWQRVRHPSPGVELTWQELTAASFEPFPRAALGLSGFEVALLLIPLIKGTGPGGQGGRATGARRMLVTVALAMSVLQFLAAFVATLLVPPEAFLRPELAGNRAVAYLAHGGELRVGGTLGGFTGPLFGSAYDVCAVLILALAGVGIGISLVSLVPSYLTRLGMQLKWSEKLNLLIYLLLVVKIAVTVYYGAGVENQLSAYAISVLMVLSGAALTACLDVRERHRGRFRGAWFALVALGFAGAAVRTAVVDPAGMLLAGWFVAAVLVVSMVTRFYRATELRSQGFDFADDIDRRAYESLQTSPILLLVPHRPGPESIEAKEAVLRERHRLPSSEPLLYVAVEVGDASEFNARPLVRVARDEGGRLVIEVTRAVSVAHVIAAVAIDMSREGTVPEVHFGWSRENPLTANLHFVLFGHGNVPWLVHTLLQHADLPAERRPRVVIG